MCVEVFLFFRENSLKCLSFIFGLGFIFGFSFIERSSDSSKSCHPHLTNKIKRKFFQAVAISVLLYRCTTCMLTKRTEKKLDENYTRIQRAVLKKFKKQQ